MRVHDCAVRGDGSSKDIVGIREVDNDYLILLSNFLSYTDEVVGLEGEGLRVTHWCELKRTSGWTYAPGRRWRQAARLLPTIGGARRRKWAWRYP